MFGLLRRYWRRLIKGLSLSLLIGSFGLITPLLTKLLFDEVYPTRDVGFMQVLVLGIAMVGISSALMGAVRGYYGQVIAARLGAELGLSFFDHLQRLPMRFFDGKPVGELLSRSGDLQRSIGFITSVFQSALVSGVYLIVVPPVLLLLNWKLALLSLIATPITSATTLLTGRAMRTYSRQQLEASAETGAYQIEVLSNVRIVRTAGAERETLGGMRDRVLESQEAQLRTAGLSVLLGVANTAVRAASGAIFSLVAWGLILDQQMTLGSFMAFSAYLGYLTGPVNQVAGMFASFQQASVSLVRFFEYFDLTVEGAGDAARPVMVRRTDLSARRGRGMVVEFEDVSFSYVLAAPVLQRASFRVEPGEVIALCGRSGEGKSSLVKLLTRLYEPDGGRILVDGSPVAHHALADLRASMGVVWQENAMLRGTLRDNLLLGMPDATDAEIDAVVRAAQLDAFVQGSAEGLGTMIAEAGGTLSGGQRQRVAIARALLRRAPVLILDEATANVDPETEHQLLQEVLAHARGATILMITHREQVARLADRVFLVSGRRVTGGLPHEAMLTGDEAYRQLWGRPDAPSDEGALRFRIRGAELEDAGGRPA
jgi:ABC-type bacteriocin/lantibiotic exporter with double-glycine peptidase domain